MGSLGRVSGFWNGLGGPSRRLIIGAVLLFIVGLFLLFRFSGGAAYSNLATGLTPDQAASLTSALDSKGIPYKLADNGATVQVPADKVDQARIDVASSGAAGGGVGYEIFDRQALGATDFTQQVNLVRAREGELARAIAKIQPVQSATVKLAVPEQKLFTSEQQPVTASVLLTLKPGQSLDSGQVRGVTNLVAMAVPGLKASNITITDQNGNILSGAGADSATASAGGRMAIEGAYERSTQSRLDAMLASILGPGMAVTSVDATLNLDKVTTDSETYNPQRTAPLEQSTSREQLQSTGGSASGTAGTTANTPGSFPATANGTGGDTRYQKTTDTQRNGVDRTRRQVVTTPGALVSQSISVMVSDKVNANQIAKIQTAVQAAVGYQQNRDTVSVQSVTFAQNAGAAGGGATATQAPAASGGGMDVMSLAKTAGVAVGVLLLLFLASRSLKGRQKGLEGQLPDLLARGPVPVAELTAAGTPEERRRLEIERKSSLQEQMEDLATNRPEDVAQLLRGWLVEGKH